MEPDSTLSAGKDQGLDIQVRADKLSLLYRQSYPAVFMSMSAALLLAVILWQHLDRAALLAWLTALLIASATRLVLFISYRHASPSGSAILDWERPYLVTLLLSSVLWGAGGVWFMAHSPPLQEAAVYYFLMGMAGGAVSVYSAIQRFALAALFIVLLPATVWMLFRGELTQVVMGVAALLLMISAIRSSSILCLAMHRNFLLTHELQASREQAEQLARTDPLTGMNNRLAFAELAQMSVNFCDRHNLPVSAIMLDIDHFKDVNDNWGHMVGDLALQYIANTLQSNIRKTDICARFGGEEFVILLPDTALEDATRVAEKIRTAIEHQSVLTDTDSLPITASCGVASGRPQLKVLLMTADEALYEAKESGRNRVVSRKIPPSDNNVHNARKRRQ